MVGPLAAVFGGPLGALRAVQTRKAIGRAFQLIQSPIGIGASFGKIEFPIVLVKANIIDIDIRLDQRNIRIDTLVFGKFGDFKTFGPGITIGRTRSGSGNAVEVPTRPELSQRLLIRGDQILPLQGPAGLFFDLRQNVQLAGFMEEPCNCNLPFSQRSERCKVLC